MNYKCVVLINQNGSHNKYYRMLQISNKEWIAEYGRIGNSPSHTTYPLSEWMNKYNEKIKKGYSVKLNYIWKILDSKIYNKILKLSSYLKNVQIYFGENELDSDKLDNNDVWFLVQLLEKIESTPEISLYVGTDEVYVSKDELVKCNEIYKYYTTNFPQIEKPDF